MGGGFLLLKCDEQLLRETQGQTAEKLERAIKALSPVEVVSGIWGAAIPLDLLIIEEERAAQFVFQLVKKYWGKVNLFLLDPLLAANLDIEFANERIDVFFKSPQSKQTIFNYVVMHGEIRFEHIVALIFGKTIKQTTNDTGLQQLFVHKIGNHYMVQPIYSEQRQFWHTIYAKKIYSLLLQAPLQQIDNPIMLMNHLKQHLLGIVTVNRMATIIHQLVQQIDYENPRSFQLKQLHLLNVMTHFTSGRRHFLKLKKCIDQVKKAWSTGQFALTEKEITLLSYMLLNEAVMKKDLDKIIEHGLFLIERDRLNDHAVELMVEYSDVLNNMKPQPQALVKNYDANYLEFVFFIVIDALVQKKRYDTVFKLLGEHELASCTAVFEVLNSAVPDEVYHKIEATVQRDIAFLVDESPQHIAESVRMWQQLNKAPANPFFEVAEMTSYHVCNLLKTFFTMEQFELFEKLLTVYKKYLLRPAHFERLRHFLEEAVEQTS